MKVYVVENQRDNPGRIAAIFADGDSAMLFVQSLDSPDDWGIIERTLWYGQPPVRGYNEKNEHEQRVIDGQPPARDVRRS